MGKWEMVRLGDVCDVRDGTHDSPKYCEVGYPLITSKNIVNGQLDFKSVNYISKNDFDAINNRSQVDMGGIIMPMIGTIGNPLIVETNKKFAIKNVALIKFSQDKVINAFVYYILNSDMFLKYVKKENRGRTQKFLSLKNIREFIIPLPPLEIQQKIAATLDTAAALLKLRQQQLAELEALIQSVFYEMFGDLVRNEKGWEIKPINEFSTVKIGPFGSLLHVSDYIENGYPLVNPAHINNGNIEPDLKLTLTDDKFAELEKYTMKKNDIVVGRRGEIGRCAVVEKEGYLCGTGSMFIRVKHDYLPLVLQRILSSKSIRKKLLNQSVGVTMKNLNSSTISNLEVPMIPLSLQTQFAAIVQKIEQQKALVQQSIDETQTLFDSLMSQYFE